MLTTTRRTLIAVACLLSLSVMAQDAKPWPQAKPITWFVGFPPGGSTDVLTRAVARRLGEKLGQSVVVENRPGASGAIALQAAAKATPDGYTLVTVDGPTLSNVPMPEIGKDLAPVSPFVQQAMVLIGPGSADLKTLGEVLNAARKDPKVWSYGTSGTGSSQHLAGELLNTLAGTTLTHVPYKGGAQAVTDVMGGQIPLAMLGVTPVLPHAQAGKVRVYAVTTEHRLESLPDVPTMSEAGIKGFIASQWYVVATSVGTPDDRIATLNNLITEIIASPELKSVLLSSGSVPSKGNAKDALNFVNQENRRWKDLAQKSKLNLTP